MPRFVLYTGKGGVGKTSVAAASALRCAAAGQRTLILSTDPAHSLSHSLEREIGSQPTELGENLWGQEIHAQQEMERHWSAVREWGGSLLMDYGINRITAEELTVPPGMDELFSLLELKRHNEEGKFETIIVDCAPTGETLRLLSFPEVARWWLEKIFPRERDILSAARPLAKAFLDIPLPDERVLDEIRVLMENLVTMNELLRDRTRVSVRLVMSPDRMVIAEAMSTFTYLNLYGYLTDAVVVNRIFPDAAADGYFSQWLEHQSGQLERVETAFTPVPILKAPYFEREVIGEEMLKRLGEELFSTTEPGGVLYEGQPHVLDLGDDSATLTIPLPLAQKGDVSLKKVGLELVVTVADQKRTMMLPPALAELAPTGAKFEADELTITFNHGNDRDTG